MDSLTHNKQLVTVYLDHNPISQDPNYRRKIKLSLPWITQIDATLARYVCHLYFFTKLNITTLLSFIHENYFKSSKIVLNINLNLIINKVITK